jgi:uncharacterized membrane protein YczE
MKKKLIYYTGKYAGQRIPRRIICMLIGVILMGLGVSLFFAAKMGSDPYSTMTYGLSLFFKISFGTLQAIVNCILLVVVLFLDRSMFGLGTLGNMFLVGFSSDFFTTIYKADFSWLYTLNLWQRIILTLIGVALILLGCSLYVTCNLGMAPYDCLSFIVPNKTKIKFSVWRILTDVSCVLIGFFCGAPVGIGTLIMAFGTGPILPFLNKNVSARILKIEDIKMHNS